MKLIVLDENTLGLINDNQPDYFSCLASSVIMGSTYDSLHGPYYLPSDASRIRPATISDFYRFRVLVDGYLDAVLEQNAACPLATADFFKSLGFGDADIADPQRIVDYYRKCEFEHKDGLSSDNISQDAEGMVRHILSLSATAEPSAVKRLQQAWADMQQFGEHDGACDNEEACEHCKSRLHGCSIHAATSQQRMKEMSEAVEGIRPINSTLTGMSVSALRREHAELRKALSGLRDAVDRSFDVDSDTRIGTAIAVVDNLLCAIRDREDSES